MSRPRSDEHESEQPPRGMAAAQLAEPPTLLSLALATGLDLIQVLDCISEAISIQDRSYRILFQNRKHVKIKERSYLGEYCYRAYHGREAVCRECPVALVFEDGQSHTLPREVRVSNQALHVEISASPLVDSSGTIVAAIEVVRDVTDQVRAKQQREELIGRLQEALHKVKTLKGLLSTCAVCSRIRDAKGNWNSLQDYIRAHTEADFSHGICPECAERLYPEIYRK